MKHVPPPAGEPVEALDNLAIAVSPKWGEAILRLAKATERVAAKLDVLPAVTDDQYIPKARELAKSLIDFLDGLEDTDHDTASDDVACDDNELDGPENEEDELSEPDEPSLGAIERHVSGYGPDGYNGSGDQSHWAASGSKDLEDEHDGAEPEDDGGDGDKENDEPSLGWPERVNQTENHGSSSGDDRELQDHASMVPKLNRGKLPNTVDVEQRGYGGRTVIRNLTDGQTEALAERMDRYGLISLDRVTD